MFTECGNLELLGRRKRGRTQAWCDKRGCDGWMEADHFIFLIIRLPVIVFDDTEAIYQ